MDDLAVRKSCVELLDRLAHGGDAFEDGWVGKHGDVILSKVNAGFQYRDQLDKLLFDRLQTPGERASKLLCGNLRLIKRLRVDKIAYRLRLREIDAPIQKGAHGEFARFGEP